jgi:hypothetical protein
MTALPTSLRRLLDALEATGCAPRQVGDGTWLAMCPSCLRQGWSSLVEIRATDTGVVVCCVAAHEPPHEEAA